MIGGKSSVVRSLKQSWRHAPLADSQASAARLDLTCDEPLPELPADSRMCATCASEGVASPMPTAMNC
ncbi:hypothetical protein V5O39_07190 [Pseudomonas parakoreensis]